MDGTIFDGLARRWATRGTRRMLLAGFAAGALARVGIPRASTAAAQTAGDSGTAPCAEDVDCLVDDLDPCTGATCADGICAFFVADCAPGHTCCGNGTCCPDGGPAPCVADADCLVAGDPCAGGRCDNGTCVTFLVLCAEGMTCCGNGACCPVAGGCGSDADCPTYPNPCLRGRCLAGSCAPAFVSCPPGEVCRNGACVTVGA